MSATSAIPALPSAYRGCATRVSCDQQGEGCRQGEPVPHHRRVRARVPTGDLGERRGDPPRRSAERLTQWRREFGVFLLR